MGAKDGYEGPNLGVKGFGWVWDFEIFEIWDLTSLLGLKQNYKCTIFSEYTDQVLG